MYVREAHRADGNFAKACAVHALYRIFPNAFASGWKVVPLDQIETDGRIRKRLVNRRVGGGTTSAAGIQTGRYRQRQDAEFLMESHKPSAPSFISDVTCSHRTLTQ